MRGARTLGLLLLLLTCLGAADLARGGLDQPRLDAVKPGEWFEAPGSALKGVLPKPDPKVYLGDPRALMKAWSGGAYDTLRDRLVVWGGGHADYGGNEVYVFDLRTLAWSRLTDPSPTTLSGGRLNEAAGQTDPLFNPDRTPVARHTYDGLEYLPPPVDRMVACGGSRWFKGGADGQVWTFDFATLKWERKHDCGEVPLTPKTARDPGSGRWYLQTAKNLIEYDPARDSWREVGKNGAWSEEGVAEIDPVRHWFVTLEKGKIFYFDMSALGLWRRKELVTTGATEILKAHAPGVAYSPTAKKLVAWSGTTTDNQADGLGDSVFVLDTDSLVWRRYQPAGPTHPPKAAPNNSAKSRGTYGRWRYVPGKDLFVGVNNIWENVYFYRLPTEAYREFGSSEPAAGQSQR